ncbi:Tetratricopeptide repeat-containing protein [Kordiimonas lacus]|uniref:Tetratricopeptide repeat-containing protein n=1 Tax=Kordiimonas lacus TaxID=637679 RepID=A0A1G6USN2_9PROT|nr:Tetratricopeptide repeat-containing protein [Kordiimonas lacus]
MAFKVVRLNRTGSAGNIVLNEALKKVVAKQYQEAHNLSMEMIRQDVKDPRPYHALGLLALDHRNFVKAVELCERATMLSPSEAVYWAAYAQVLSVVGRQNDAREAAEKAAALPVNDPMTADIIAVVFSRAGFHERAVPFFRQAISLNPGPANFHYNLASSLQFAGRFEEAEEAYKETLARDAEFFKAHSGLVALKKQTSGDNRLDELLPMFDRLAGDADAALHLGHAIAKTYEDLGEYDESLVWLKRAKAQNRERYPTDEAEQADMFKAAVETAGFDAAGAADGAPIFVVGLPRTGTTLVDRILSTHPDVVSAGELNVFAGLVKAKAGSSSNMVLDAETLRMVEGADLAEIGNHYMAATKVLARGAERFVDKMPLNFFYAALILKALPNARIVALRRGAMDSCLSNYRQLFSTQFSYYNYTYDLESTAQFYRGFDGLMAQWRDLLPADRFMEIRYEDIVFDQEAQTRRLLDFCGLDWFEGCLRFHENAAPVSTASSVQVRQPLYSGSIGRWKRYSDEGLEPLTRALRDLAQD